MHLSEKTKLLLKILIPAAIGIGVTILLFGKEFNSETLSSIQFSSTIWGGIVLALIATFFRDFGLAWRFKSITDDQLKWKQAAKITGLCEFTSAITPTSVGGSALSMIFLQREGIKLGRATSLTLTTLFLDELFFVIAVPLVFLVIPAEELFGFADSALASELRATFWIVYGIICVIAAALFIAIFISPKLIGAIIKGVFRLPILRRWKSGAEKTASDLILTSAELRGKTLRWWSRPAAATVISWCGRFLVVNALIWAVAPQASQDLVLGRQLIVWALLTFTPTPGGAGVSEYLFKTYYSDILAGPMLMAVAIIWRVFTYYIYLLAGFFLLPLVLKKKS